jgi:cytochrome P450
LTALLQEDEANHKARITFTGVIMATCTQSASAAVPSHVSPDRVHDFDFIGDPALAEDPHNRILRLVADAPRVFFTPQNGGHWVIAGREEAFQVTKNTEVFSSRQMALPPMEDEPMQIPINLDPPMHASYRMVLNRAFAPKPIAELEKSIRELTNQLIDEVIVKDGCEFVQSVAEPLPVSVFLKMMGIPLDRLDDFRSWVMAILAAPKDPSHTREWGYMSVVETMSQIIAERMENRGDDLVSRMLDADINGKPPSFEEMVGFCLLLVIAGLDTVVNGMSFGVRHLANDKAMQARLRANPDQIPEAVEELLRRYTFTVPGRIVAQDAELFGVKFKANDRVLLLLPAVGLDSEYFPDADKADLDRENKNHMAFNSGPHRCVGSHLARLELKVLYEEWLRRIPEFSLSEDRAPKFNGGHVFGVSELHLNW